MNRLFHDYVCKDSKDTRVCLNLECEKYHISGTRRVERFIDSDPQVNENATRAVDFANQTALSETSSAVAGRSACTSKEEYPGLKDRGAVPKKPVVTERVVAKVPHRVQNCSSYAHAVKIPQQIRLQESDQVKTLHEKITQFQSRVQNIEKLVQQLMSSNGYKAPISREKGNVNERNDQTNEGACSTWIQNTENAVKDLYAKFHQMGVWIQNCQHPVNLQLHPVQNATCQTQAIPNITHAIPPVFHNPSYIPQVIENSENFGIEEPSFVSL